MTSRIKTNVFFDVTDFSGRKHNHDTHHKNHSHHNPTHGQTLEQQRDEVSQLMLARDQLQVREIGLYHTCWWYSLCNFQYRQHYENTGSYNLDC
jgi:hypothetical protein